MYDKGKNREIRIQRGAATSVKTILTGLEEIKFDEKGGSISGAGSWSCGADVKINGKWYGIITAKDGVFGMKAGFPQENEHGGTKTPLKVIYSNGQSEVLK